jgi:chromosome segregation ATPase
MFELFRANQTRIAKYLLNTAQLSYRTGRKISYIAGSESYVFEIQPDKFSFTDYAISVSFASQDKTKVDQLKAMAKEFVSAGVLEPDIITKAVLSDSATELSRIISEGWAKKKAEDDTIGQAKSQIEQYEKQLKELEKNLNNVTQQLEAAKTANTKAKEMEVQNKKELGARELELEEKKAKDLKDFNDAKISLEREKTQLEREQLYLGTGKEKEINFNS